MKTLHSLAIAVLAASPLLAAETSPAAPASSPSKRVLFVLTSHDKKGDTGESTGFWTRIAPFSARRFCTLATGE